MGQGQLGKLATFYLLEKNFGKPQLFVTWKGATKCMEIVVPLGSVYVKQGNLNTYYSWQLVFREIRRISCET